MEVWQRNHIRSNLPDLLRNTDCSTIFLSSLYADGVVSDEEINILGTTNNPVAKAKTFYGIVQTRCNSYNFLKQALKDTSQTGALAILDICNEHNSSTPFKYYGTISYSKTLLGQGCYNTSVYKGKFENRDVAVKVINTQYIEVKRALKEVDFLMTIDWHENVVRYFRTEITDDFVHIAMELCDMSLHDCVVKKKNIGIQGLEVIRQATTGITHLHCSKIVHGDLKPANILLVSHATGRVVIKISDFGMSKKIPDGQSRLSVHTSGVGTEGWTAPEVVEHRLNMPSSESVLRIGFESDIFPLGCIFYFVLTDGIHPFGDHIRRQGNILDGKVMMCEEKMTILKTGSSVYIKLIKEMIADKDIGRPSASEVLSRLLELERSEEMEISKLGGEQLDSAIEDLEQLSTSDSEQESEDTIDLPRDKSPSYWNKYFGNFMSRTAFGSYYNNLFGRNTTHIKNNASKIVVAVIASCSAKIEEMRVQNGTINIKFEDDKEVILQKGLIAPGNIMPFERINSADYLTIVMINSDGGLTETATNTLIRANNSYQIDENGTPWFVSYDDF